MENDRAPAIRVDGLRKRLGAVTALDGLSLRVAGGTIYGLLGPNGSGKTTLIRALAGLVRPDAGTVTVFGRTPRAAVAAGMVGYMRTRVSLAAALLHRPPLLLLDEPTVGVDPALRRDFWDHFRSLARAGTTILVSSHVPVT